MQGAGHQPVEIMSSTIRLPACVLLVMQRRSMSTHTSAPLLARVLGVRMLLALVLLVLVATTACTPTLPHRAVGALPGTAPTATPRVEVAGVTAAPGSAEAAIQTVILR